MSTKRGNIGRACLVLGLAAALASLTACGGSSKSQTGGGDPKTDKLAQVLARGTLVEYFEPDYPPQSMNVKGATRPANTKCRANQLTSAEVTGYDNAVTKLLAAKLGVEACFVSPTWTEVTSGNWGDRWDVTYGSGSINADRMQRLYMTQPYYAVPNYYFVRVGSPAHHASDLDGKRIGSCSSCSHEAYLKGELVIPGVEITLNVKNPQSVTYETEGPGLRAAAAGRVDAFLAAEPVGNALIKEGVKLRRLPELAFTYYPSGFVDKSSGLSETAFVNKIDELIQGFEADGTLKNESLKWFGHDYVTAAAKYDLSALHQEVK